MFSKHLMEKIIKLFSSKPNTPKAFLLLELYWGIPTFNWYSNFFFLEWTWNLFSIHINILVF